MSNQTKNNNLNYWIDPTFTNMNRILVLIFENEDDRTSFSKYYLPKVETKDFNALINGKPFFEIPVKNKKHMKHIEMTKIMITQQAIYWIMNISKITTNYLQ